MENSPVVPPAEWQHAFQRVLTKADSTKLRDLIVTAEASIFNRLQVLASNPNCKQERQTLFDALTKLRVLMTDVLGYPDWRGK